MQEDSEGFLYPIVNTTLCTNCSLCERVCPVVNRFDSSAKPNSFGARALDDTLRSVSSSGGVFSLLAAKIIESGGVVYGARFADDWSIVHNYTESLEGLTAFRGSKYVQSEIGDAYKTARSFLNGGRTVLFSGTPCQVSGLNHFLGKKYANLYTVDVVCHSVASPKVWRMYLDEMRGDNKVINVDFRDKTSYGWHNYGLRIDCLSSDDVKFSVGGTHEGSKADDFMRAFSLDMITRPSCYYCPARNYTSGSDIRLADFWHLEKYHPELDDNLGMSEVLVITEKGKALLESIKDKMSCFRIPYCEVEENGVHSPITRSCVPNRYRTSFFQHLEENYVSKSLHRYVMKSDLELSIRKMIQVCWKRKIAKRK